MHSQKRKRKHIIHIRGLTDKQLETLWSIRYYLKASNWVEVIAWLIEKYKEEVKQKKIFI